MDYGLFWLFLDALGNMNIYMFVGCWVSCKAYLKVICLMEFLSGFLDAQRERGFSPIWHLGLFGRMEFMKNENDVAGARRYNFSWFLLLEV